MNKLDIADEIATYTNQLDNIAELMLTNLNNSDISKSKELDRLYFLINYAKQISNGLYNFSNEITKEWCQMIIPDAKTKQIYNMIVNSTSKHPVATKKISDVTGLNERTIRNRITELIFIYKVPIGAFRTGNNKGYFLIKNQDEYNQVRNTLKAQAFEELKRVNQLRENLKNWSDERWQHTHLI